MPRRSLIHRGVADTPSTQCAFGTVCTAPCQDRMSRFAGTFSQMGIMVRFTSDVRTWRLRSRILKTGQSGASYTRRTSAPSAKLPNRSVKQGDKMIFASVIFAAVAAGFWIWSSTVKFPERTTIGNLDDIYPLLRKQSRRSAWAALSAAAAALFQVLPFMINFFVK